MVRSSIWLICCHILHCSGVRHERCGPAASSFTPCATALSLFLHQMAGNYLPLCNGCEALHPVSAFAIMHLKHDNEHCALNAHFCGFQASQQRQSQLCIFFIASLHLNIAGCFHCNQAVLLQFNPVASCTASM